MNDLERRSLLGDKEAQSVNGMWKQAGEIKSFKHTNIPVVECSKCGVCFCDIINNHDFMYHYCPNCGTDMRGENK